MRTVDRSARIVDHRTGYYIDRGLLERILALDLGMRFSSPEVQEGTDLMGLLSVMGD